MGKIIGILILTVVTNLLIYGGILFGIYLLVKELIKII